MINPSEIVDNLVALLRDISDLVAEMGDDSDNIYAYHDRYPDRVSLEQAKHQLASPGIMIAWQGTREGRNGDYSAWVHDLSITLRAKVETGSGTPDGYYKLYRQIVKGVPASGDGQPMIYTTVHSSCTPMDSIPSIQRLPDAEGLDYFEIVMSFTEIGDE